MTQDNTREALAELVYCKDLKERIIALGYERLGDGSTDTHPDLPELRREYDQRMPLAWAAARAALSAPAPQVLPAELNEHTAAAHMYPSDLERFQHGECTGGAFSIAVGCPEETSVPLFTLEQVIAALSSQPPAPQVLPITMTPELEKAFQDGFIAELHKPAKHRTITAEAAGLRAMARFANEMQAALQRATATTKAEGASK